ncbi:MAG: 3-deoxy-manno-octulosonate cytidylyltransferase [Gammaproteobacteria bacterium SG8_30]|nr:MAG: 3-deoxy-manno-octulosonate cytidylyltransferase [Gammaproteobacteria bacterium SG8_30]
MFRAVIPARFASTRLPGKPLADLGGKPMVRHVHERVVAAGAAEVIVATDDARVSAACAEFGAEVEMTSAEHPSGTDRLAEVAARRGWRESDTVVNVQGDEPLLPPVLVQQVAALLRADPGADVATLGTPIGSLEEFLDPAVVKVVRRADGRALYFSRAPIPWHREGAPAGVASQQEFAGAWRHLGLYAYRVGALKRLAAAEPAPLELIEKLEQLRALYLGMVITVGEAVERPAPGVDTPQDLERVRAMLRKGPS